jgi:hypothetical protein
MSGRPRSFYFGVNSFPIGKEWPRDCVTEGAID